MTNIDTKHPWVFSFFFFRLYFFLTFFSRYIYNTQRPLDGEWNSQQYKQDKQFRDWNNILYTKNNKKRKTNNKLSFLKFPIFLKKSYKKVLKGCDALDEF